ncbi:MAG TPA: hypothetical protein VHU14_02565 [Solirubrobacterales bacterium]|jgi:hypothetical protein|nr:hypothetical protein [Solirubrobacterales bacterium]
MKKLIGAFVVLAVLVPAAAAAAAAHFIKVEPTVVEPGHVVRVFGSVAGGGCPVGSSATLISTVFKGATKEEFAGVPAVNAKVRKGFKFSVKVTLSKGLKPGKYEIGGRCGGGNFGSAKLRVKHK